MRSFKENISDAREIDHKFIFPVADLRGSLSNAKPQEMRFPSKLYVAQFCLPDWQRKQISSYKKVFGGDLLGLTRILTRARITDFYRQSMTKPDFVQ